MGVSRIFLLAVLSLSLVLAGAMLPGHASAGGQSIVICSGDGTRVVTLDANGDPVETDAHCPACHITLATPVPLVAGDHQPADLHMGVPPLARFVVLRRPFSGPMTRGPPLLV